MENKHGPQRSSQRHSIDGFAMPKSYKNKRALPLLAPSSSPLSLQKSEVIGAPSLINRNLVGQGGETLPGIKDKKKKIKKKWSRKRKILSTLLIIAVIILGTGGYYGSRIIGSIDKVFHGNIFSDVSALFSTTTLKGESQGRINILLAGDSSDQIGHGGADLTDSILIASIDTKNHTVFLLSIPRDLWVYVPGLNSWEKINAANDVTNFSEAGYPSGGMGQLQEIIQNDLGIPIDYYALMDYGAFKDSVNAVGGVTIDIQSSDPRGLFDPDIDYGTHQYLADYTNGLHTLNGEQALDLARARGEAYGSYGFDESDFQRTKDQRELFIAVAEKAKTLGIISNPARVSDLFSALGNNVQTNLSLKDVLRLIQLTKGINPSAAQSYAFSSTLTGSTNPILTDYTDPATGAEAIIPTAGIGDYSQLTQYYDQLTSSNPVVKEGASVVILNGSNVVGLAKAQENILTTKGVSVASIADASTEYPSTMIVDNSKGTMPATLALLKKLYPGVTVTTDTAPTEATEAQGYSANFVVILGENWDSTTQ